MRTSPTAAPTLRDRRRHLAAAVVLAAIVATGCGGGDGDGGATVETLAGGFSVGDHGAATATFVAPGDVAVDGAGNVFVLDRSSVVTGGLIRRVDRRTGVITTVAGGCPAPFDDEGPAVVTLPTKACELGDVAAIAVSRSGDLFAATFQGQVFVIDGARGGLRLLAGSPGGPDCEEPVGADALEICLGVASALAVNSDGHLFVAEPLHGILRIAGSGALTIVAGSHFGRRCNEGRDPPYDRCSQVTHLTVDRHDDLVVVSIPDRQVQRVDVPTGALTTIIAGAGDCGDRLGDGGPVAAACFERPTDVAVGPSGELFVVDRNRLRRVDAATGLVSAVAEVAANGRIAATPDGGVIAATAAALDRLDGLSGARTAVAGNGTISVCGEGGRARDACVGQPAGVAVDAADNVYFTDGQNFRVARIDAARGVVTTIGGGTRGFCGDGGPATEACFDAPTDVVADAAGNLFVADRGDVDQVGALDVGGRIRRIDATSGTITTIAGNCIHAGSPHAVDACLARPRALVLDGAGGLLVGDDAGIRRIDLATNALTAIAGIPFDVPGCDGENVPATEACLAAADLARDDGGNLFVLDTQFERIRRIDAVTGLVTTVAGNGVFGFCGDEDVPATSTCLSAFAIAIDAGGRLIIASGGTLRAVDPATGRIRTVAGDRDRGERCLTGAATFADCVVANDLERDRQGRWLFSDSLERRIGRVTVAPPE